MNVNIRAKPFSFDSTELVQGESIQQDQWKELWHIVIRVLFFALVTMTYLFLVKWWILVGFHHLIDVFFRAAPHIMHAAMFG